MCAVSEERYVVRDKYGELWFWSARCLPSSLGETRARQRHKMSRAKACDLIGHLEAEDSPQLSFGPYKLYRLVRKPKPKAPREVFLVVEPSGMLADCPPEDDREAAEENANRPGERVVRYVLAEVEK